jgi:hypothetical protein
MNLENIFKVIKYKDIECHEIDSYIKIEKVEGDDCFYRTLINPYGTIVYDESDIKVFKEQSLFKRKMLEAITDYTYIKEKLKNYKSLDPFKGSTYYNVLLVYMYTNWNDRISKALKDLRKITTQEVNYISVTKDGFKFLPTGKKLILDNDGNWSDKNRQVIKFSKLIRRLLKEPSGFTDSDYELFSNRVKSYIGIFGDEDGKGKYELKILEGEELRKAYLENNCSKILCSGGSSHPLQSCMRYEKCQPYLDLYAHNPNIVKMLVLKDDNNLVGGRALLWHVGNKIYMDRIYGTDAIIQIFKAWAIDNNCVYKNHQNNNSAFDMLGNNAIRNSKIKIPINIDDLKYFPYLDTMQYYDFENKYLTNKEPKGKCLVLRSTSGTMEIRRNYTKFLDQLTGEFLRDDIHTPIRVHYTIDGTDVDIITSYNNTCRIQDFVNEANHVTVFSSGTRFLIRDSVLIGTRFYKKDDARLVLVDGVYKLKQSSVLTNNISLAC